MAGTLTTPSPLLHGVGGDGYAQAVARLGHSTARATPRSVAVIPRESDSREAQAPPEGLALGMDRHRVVVEIERAAAAQVGSLHVGEPDFDASQDPARRTPKGD
jgi:hypothetical protein